MQALRTIFGRKLPAPCPVEDRVVPPCVPAPRAGVFYLYVKPEHGYYVEVDPLDGDIRRIEVVDQTPDGGLPFVPTIQPAFTMGRPIETEFVPTRMRWCDRQGHPIPDFNDGHILNVSSRARDVIESLEPGVHQFLPVEYVDLHDRSLEQRWFLIACNRSDGVDRANSRLRLVKGMLWSADQVEDPKFVFSRSQVAGQHLWVDKHITTTHFVSGALADRIMEHGLTGVRLPEAVSV